MAVPKGERRAVGFRSSEPLRGRLARGSPYLGEAAGNAQHTSQIGSRFPVRLHSYELGRAAHQSLRLSLVSDAYGNPAMTSRYSASSSS